MKALIPLAVALVVPLALVYAITRISRWHAGQTDDIDALIATNAAKQIAGMERVCWTTAERAVAKHKLKALRAQRKARQKPQPAQPRIVRRTA